MVSGLRVLAAASCSIHCIPAIETKLAVGFVSPRQSPMMVDFSPHRDQATVSFLTSELTEAHCGDPKPSIPCGTPRLELPSGFLRGAYVEVTHRVP